ncbi:MAG TPA: hypothetical protein VMX35_05595 [Acidobacteriota bacterium]|nr:hypothetical protein [Acidobacteriota bacterium]
MFGLRTKYPPASIEIGDGYASAVRLQRSKSELSLAEWHRADFPFRSVKGDDLGAELLLDDDMRLRLGDLADRLGRVKRLSLVLPDTAVRTLFLELENPAATGKELDDMIRFKLSRLVPINLDAATLAYHRLPEHSGGANYLAVLTSKRMTVGLEEFFSSRGTHLGLIESASLAAVNLASQTLESAGDSAIVRVALHYFTINLFLGGELSFGRTRRFAPEQSQTLILQELRTLNLFAQDKLGSEGLRAVFLYGPGFQSNGIMTMLNGAGFDARALDLEEFAELPADLRGRPQDQGTVLAAVGAACRS